MKIGDEVYVHGYVDEIRGNTVIIKNKGGYFGTCKKEVKSYPVNDRTMYSTDIYSVVVHDKMIEVFDKRTASITMNVWVDRKEQAR